MSANFDAPDPMKSCGTFLLCRYFAIAVLCAREGAGVACADRDEAAARDTAQRISGEGNRASVVIADVQDEAGARAAAEIEAAGGRASFVHADVGRGQDVEGMVAFAVERYGRLDILVNNAHWEKHGTVVELEAPVGD